MQEYYIGNKLKLIDDSTDIGGGREADIFPIDDNYALKRIKEEYREKKGPKIGAFLDHYSLVGGNEIEMRLGYPLEIARERYDGAFCGFSMRRFSTVKQILSLYYLPFQGKYGRADLDDSAAFQIVRTLFSDLETIHKECNMTVGDMNPKNILVSNDNKVYWIDVDSFGIPEHPTRVKGMPDYICPYVLESPKDIHGNYRHNQGSDIYVLTIIVFHFLVGFHPFQAPCHSPMSTVAAMKENLNYISLIRGNDKFKNHQAFLGPEYQKGKDRLTYIKGKAPDIYEKLYTILGLGDRTLKSSNTPSTQKKKTTKQRPRQQERTTAPRVRGSFQYPDPPEFQLFLQRYNITLP